MRIHIPRDQRKGAAMCRVAWGLVFVAAIAGCNRSGNTPGDPTQMRTEAIEALKALDARFVPEEPSVDKPVTEIALDGDAVTDEALAHVARFPTLQTLRLRNTAVTSAGLAHLKGLTALQKLDLSGTHVG